MNTGQTLITIGAIVLLSFVILRMNNNFLSTGTVLNDSKTGVMAISLATSTMERASSLAFDENTDTTSVESLSMLTHSIDLGPDLGEAGETDFDDFDDYNGFTKIENLPNGQYTTICEVGYVYSSDPNTIVSSRTWHKKITVKVTSNSLIRDWDTMVQDTISFTKVFSYWYFVNVGSGG